MGIYNSTWNLGWIIGPSLGGFLSDQIGFRMTFVISVLIIATGLAISAFLLPKR